MLSNKSPTMEKPTVAMQTSTKPNQRPPTPRTARPIKANSSAAAIAPHTPSQVLPGLMVGASLRRPQRRPAK